MKKQNEGYVLPFVLVVTVVLCLVAVAVLSSALDNFTAQQDSIARMQDKYAAQGEIEKIVASDFHVLTSTDTDTGATATASRVSQGSPEYAITAICGNVTIKCTFDSNTKSYISYTVSPSEPADPAATTSTTGGDGA